ncbi:penicillin-binding transpeptidase domain-containing protein [Butyrivibrio fibrisolvens]|uniref:penicillin-binding transpeptidase domain-containing protein n=1 Tax=Butyrivibrio fibrisolvens TaxID=831 RepID=UPI0003FC71D0|nr:penicillin-binding transpeptidase domain-containing protein [Butyrivibrio fibrisolvens]
MKDKKEQRFTWRMKKKLRVMFVCMMLIFAILSARLVSITRNNGADYEKQVLSQQEYDSVTLPYRRGEILDKNGTVLAMSQKVYNVILDTRVLLEKKDAVEPTIKAIVAQFGDYIDESTLRTYISNNPSSAYYIIAKELQYDQIAPFQAYMTPGSGDYNANIQGVWFEDSYIRYYPNGSLACDIVGFTTKDNQGQYGLEEYYNDELNGTYGREYGYLDEESTLERTTIAAVDGNSIVTTIDGNIQSIVEKYLQEFNDTYKDSYHEGNAAENVGCIVMDVNSGEILAMASYPSFDLNNTRDSSKLLGMRMVDELGNKVDLESETGGYINETNLANMSSELLLANYNALWRNFCISNTYEPGSVFKPFTVAAALDNGSITGNEVYQCNGSLEIGGHDIRCHNRYGDGQVSVGRSIEISCNVALMQIGQTLGSATFAGYQHTFGFGLKTNVDLAGEARTAGLVYTADTMGPTELATGTFGQGFNVTMIETIAGFASLINGGYYYQPHFVSKIVSPSGATVKTIEPRIIRQTISETVSDKIVSYCNLVVAGEEGTGKTARPAGYMIGGKTGTAETIPRDKTNYVVSFMGYAPADDPEIAIYVVVDRPNAQFQADAKFATRIVRKVLTEVLPYLHYPMTEPVTEEEQAELDALNLSGYSVQSQDDTATYDSIEDGNASGQSGDTNVDDLDESQIGSEGVPMDDGTAQDGTDTQEDGEAGDGSSDASEEGSTRIWETFDVDPETGYYIDPNTGELIDPETGDVVGGGESSLPDTTANTPAEGDGP